MKEYFMNELPKLKQKKTGIKLPVRNMVAFLSPIFDLRCLTPLSINCVQRIENEDTISLSEISWFFNNLNFF